ncbi:magnesium and cobalt transport protein CorA [Nocardiopsis sp. Huas11]|uniref:magnesium and cobalt transport protein CorA n=1 Tax=Nocardiopsis sp. Huas11 TaxID=2183912 RepID=UPI000EAB9F73|nr:magnesium and cobalt transport protein CorA [Nocardiopsis sp. Huas11]
MSDWRARAVRRGKNPFTRSPRRPGAPDPSPGQEPAPEWSMDPRANDGGTPVEAPLEHSVVDAALYRDGRRVRTPGSLEEIYGRLPDERGSTMAWIGLYRPAEAQMLAAADQFNLHELAVEDAIVAHQRPKLERYGDTLFVVLRAARYIDETEEVEFGEIHLFVGRDFVLTVRHADVPDLAAVRARLEGDPELLALGPESVLYAILDAVVDGYAPVIAGLQHDVDEIETEVFSGDPRVSRRIYELSREVIEFQRATRPLLRITDDLTAGFDKYGTDEELQRRLRDVADHATTAAERVDGFRQMLQNILAVNATLVSQAQNEEMKLLAEAGHSQNNELKRISSWAAILFAPTLIGTVYGMNFTRMPELDWAFGYPFSVGLMALVCVCLYVVFKRRDWL